MPRKVSLYDAKTQLSALVDQAAGGNEIIICKNGVPKARLAPGALRPRTRSPSDAMKVTYIAEDFDAPDPELNGLFETENYTEIRAGNSSQVRPL